MLVLTRKPGQEVRIGKDITIQFLGVRGNQVRFGIEAPKDVLILRTELESRAPVDGNVEEKPDFLNVDPARDRFG